MVWNTTDAPVGRYYVFTKIADAAHTRYLYAPQPITLLDPGSGLALLPAPTLLSPTNGANGQSTTPSFSWSHIDGATSYRILVATNPAALPTDPTVGICAGCILNATTPSTNYTLSALVLKPATTYYWQVHARSPDFFGTWSGWNSFTTAGAIYWTGNAGDALWFNTNNWNPKRVPTVSDAVVINSNAVAPTAASSFASITFNGGTMSGTLNVDTVMNWTGGMLSGPLRIGAGASLSISGPGEKDIAAGVQVANAGSVVWSGTGNMGWQDGVRWWDLPDSHFEVENDATIFRVSACCGWSYPALVNAGTFRKVGGNNTTTRGANVAFYNFPPGLLEVDSGTINLQGFFTNSSPEALVFGIGGPPTSGKFGKLNIAVCAELPRGLRTVLLNGFLPTFGQTFQVMSFPCTNGIFSNISVPCDGTGHRFQVRVTSRSATLVVTNCSPPKFTAVDTVDGLLHFRFQGESGVS